MHSMLEAPLKFTNVPLLCRGDVYIKEEMQDPNVLSSALQMFPKCLPFAVAFLEKETFDANQHLN